MASHLKMFWRFLMENGSNEILQKQNNNFIWIGFEASEKDFRRHFLCLEKCKLSQMIRFQRIFYNQYFIRLSSISVVYAIASQLRCVGVCVCFFPCFSPFVIHSTLKFRFKITLFLDLCECWKKREREKSCAYVFHFDFACFPRIIFIFIIILSYIGDTVLHSLPSSVYDIGIIHLNPVSSVPIAWFPISLSLWALTHKHNSIA